MNFWHCWPFVPVRCWWVGAVLLGSMLVVPSPAGAAETEPRLYDSTAGALLSSSSTARER